jgi:O-antigen ligase
MSSESSSSRPSRWEWLTAGLLVVNLAWTTLCLGGYRPETMVVTSALNGVLLAVHFAGRAFAPAGGVRRIHPAGWWLLPFLAYALANVWWVTPVPWLGWRDWLGWAQMILVFWVVLNGVRATATRTLLFGALVAVALAGAVLACYQRFVQPDWLAMARVQAEQFIGRASGSFGIPNSLAALLLLVLPAAGVLACRRGASAVWRVGWGAVALTLAIGLVLTISRGAWLALAVVLAVWPALAVEGSIWRRVRWMALATLGVGVVAAALYFSLPQVRDRFQMMKADMGEKTRPIMWRGAWQIFQADPLVGGGAGSFNVRFEQYRPERYQDEPQWAHNDYLNTLSDYGAVGFLLCFGAGAVLALRTWRGGATLPRDWLDERVVAGALMAGVVAFGLQLFVDFHFKIPALAMAFAIAAALLVQRGWAVGAGNGEVSRMGKMTNLVASVAVLGAMFVWVVPFYRAEALRYGARQAINRLATTEADGAEQRRVLAEVRTDLARAVELSPTNGQAWADVSYAAAL